MRNRIFRAHVYSAYIYADIVNMTTYHDTHTAPVLNRLCEAHHNYGHLLHGADIHEPLWWVGRVPM